jgi:hypothetical protein
VLYAAVQSLVAPVDVAEIEGLPRLNELAAARAANHPRLDHRSKEPAALVLIACERKGKAAFALADLLSGRGLERPCETLVAWAREA